MMPSHILRLTIDRLTPREAMTAPSAVRACYVAEGMASFRAGGAVSALSTGSAHFATGGLEVEAGKDGAAILRYELCRADAAGAGAPVLEAGLTLEDPDGYLLRCDQVALPPGGIAYTHTHRGGGIRCLLEGGFNVEVAGKTAVIGPLEAWFEAGPEPVYAYAPEDRPGRFSRVMILPRRLKGRSSIRYVNPEDADKPKRQTYTVFLDEFIET